MQVGSTLDSVKFPRLRESQKSFSFEGPAGSVGALDGYFARSSTSRAGGACEKEPAVFERRQTADMRVSKWGAEIPWERRYM
ncbi:conserved hypothetical protein [Mesorhizobium escarrei]|uniref:Uncharacterized protein n=1 Tax=Mesorhizobium escarrei TaxID=666018 RepID=A0ABN8JNM0_9HYPH|nr:conserved hypothetical protein [Mesorhizobium escarrei]